MKRLYLHVFKPNYEERFDAEMLRDLQVGDVVWDIGANVGFFSKRFSGRVGSVGAVHAFEPSPQTFTTLSANVADCGNVRCHNVGLSGAVGTLRFGVSEHANDPTNHFVGRDYEGPTVTVQVKTGDWLVAAGQVAAPDAIKIDVEGHELEVLNGLRTTLASNKVRSVFLEVHFAQLNERGYKDAPVVIVDIFRRSGFRVRWVDSSHIIATRY